MAAIPFIRESGPKEHPTFHCSACGKCCSHIRGMISDNEQEFLKEYAYGKMPIVQLIPIEKMSFPLWDWEARRMITWAQERGIEHRIMPSRAILDLDSDAAIIVTYSIDSDACTFLASDGKCRIYGEKRAYICRLFPFNKTPFLSTEETPDPKEYFGSCSAMKTVLPHIPQGSKEQISFFAKAFPDGSFHNAVQHDHIIEWVNKTVISLMKERRLRPAMNYPYALLMRRIGNAKAIDFTEFLVESGHSSREERDNLIKAFDANSHAEEKIAQYL